MPEKIKNILLHTALT